MNSTSQIPPTPRPPPLAVIRMPPPPSPSLPFSMQDQPLIPSTPSPHMNLDHKSWLLKHIILLKCYAQQPKCKKWNGGMHCVHLAAPWQVSNPSLILYAGGAHAQLQQQQDGQQDGQLDGQHVGQPDGLRDGQQKDGVLPDGQQEDAQQGPSCVDTQGNDAGQHMSLVNV